ncbi:hypothetical protein BY996DRAFT_6409060 [Phakopsora pachyrhizi]|nr:hypothetical protein BY996DRAFT_6409060 [Phakopsora pachyrhizi]
MAPMHTALLSPPPSPHSVIDNNFLPITTHSQDWMDVNKGFFEEVPTDDCNSGVVSTVQSGKRSGLKKAGIPTGGIPIFSKGWTTHNGVVSNQVGTSEHWARSQLQRAKAASTAQHAKRQLANPSTLTKVIWADLETVAVGSSSDEDGGKDRRGNTAEKEEEEYCPLAETTSRPPSQPTRRLPNPPQGVSTTTMAGKKSASKSTSALLAPPPILPKATPPRVVV